MNIRPLRESEIGDVSRIVGRNWGEEYVAVSRKEFEAMFTEGVLKPSYIVAEQEKRIVGVAGYVQSWMDYRVYQMFWVNVLPELRGQGIGTSLIERVIQDVKSQEGADRKASTILITATRPDYFERFGFKTLYSFEKSKLMELDF